MRVAHVARVQGLRAEHLRARRMLRELLFGAPVASRGDDYLRETSEALSRALHDASRLSISCLSCNASAVQQAELEWSRVAAMPPTYSGIMAKRAALLYAASVVPSVLRPWAESDAALVKRLQEVVLPLVIPTFVRGMAQSAASLVVLVDVLSDLWEGEDFVH